MALLLGRHQIFLELIEDEDIYKGLSSDDEETKKNQMRQLMELNSNSKLHQYFHSLGRELDIMEPKTPEGIYKAHLENTRKFLEFEYFWLNLIFCRTFWWLREHR